MSVLSVISAPIASRLTSPIRFVITAVITVVSRLSPSKDKSMKIAVDAMGGDKAPHETVKGAVIAAQRFPDDEMLLVGDEKRFSKNWVR